MTFYRWSKTAADNDDADATINLREAQAPSTYNNAVRALMAAAAKGRDDESGNLVTGGSATAYTVTTNQVYDALTDGITVTVRMHATSGAAPTFSPDGLTAKAIQSAYGVAVATGALLSGAIYKFTYDATADAWIVAGGALALGAVPIGTSLDFNGAVCPARFLFEYGQAVSRTTYAALFAVIGTAHGVGDGSTTFNVPDSRGRVTAGKDDMGGTSANRLTAQTGGVEGDTLGAVGGAETHALTEEQLAAHDHDASVIDPGHFHTFTHTDSAIAGSPATPFVSSIAQSGGAVSVNTQSKTTGISVDVADAGSGAAHNNVQPTIVKNKIIYAGV